MVTAEKKKQGMAKLLGSIWDLVRERGLTTGDQLPSIRELADRLEVKQTVIRDAMLRAESLGMVKVMPRAGVFLRSNGPLPNGLLPGTVAADKQPGEPVLAGVFQAALSSEEHNALHLLDARRLVEIELAGRAAERRRLEDLLPIRRSLEAMLQLPDTATRAEHVQLDIRFHIEVARLGGNLALLAVQRTLLEMLVPHLNGVPQTPQRRDLTDRSHVAIFEALVANDAERARNEMREHLNLAYDSLLRDIQQPPAVTRSSEVAPPAPGQNMASAGRPAAGASGSPGE